MSTRARRIMRRLAGTIRDAIVHVPKKSDQMQLLNLLEVIHWLTPRPQFRFDSVFLVDKDE